MKIDEEMRQMEQEILSTEGSKKFGSKFKTSEFNKNF